MLTQLLGSVPFALRNSFSVKILKMTKVDIGIGAIDSRYRTERFAFQKAIDCYADGNVYTFGGPLK